MLPDRPPARVAAGRAVLSLGKLAPGQQQYYLDTVARGAEEYQAAIAAVLGDASWQRCRTHFMANLATKVPKASWPMVATLVRSIFEQPDATPPGSNSATSSTS